MPFDPFISTDDLEEYLGYELDPDKAVMAVDIGCQTVRDEAEQTFNLVEDDEVLLDSEGTDTILLPEGPIVDVTSVTLTDTDFDLTADVDFVVDTEMTALRTKRRGIRFLPGRQVYAVVYSHGYSVIPASIRGVALAVAARVYDQQLVRQETAGGYTALYAASEAQPLTAAEKHIVAKHAAGRRR